MISKRAINYTTNPNKGSFANLFNPFAAFVSVTDAEGVRIPDFIDSAFVKGLGLNRQSVGMVTHALVSAGVIAGGIGLLRMMAKRKNSDGMVSDEKKQSTNMSTVGNMDLNDNLDKKATYGGAILAGALPVLGMIALSEYAIKEANDKHKKQLSEDIDRNLAERKETLNSLVMQRIKSARGGVTDKEFNDLQARIDALPNLSKGASMDKRALWPFNSSRKSLFESGFGYAGAAAALAAILSGLASYEYIKQNDDGNKKLKAYEKGIKEYARQKALSDPMLMQLSDDPAAERKILDSMDKARAASAAKRLAAGTPINTVRDEVAFDGRLNKPVSVTLD